jgi:hypothetical protein
MAQPLNDEHQAFHTGRSRGGISKQAAFGRSGRQRSPWPAIVGGNGRDGGTMPDLCRRTPRQMAGPGEPAAKRYPCQGSFSTSLMMFVN